MISFLILLVDDALQGRHCGPQVRQGLKDKKACKGIKIASYRIAAICFQVCMLPVCFRTTRPLTSSLDQ